MAEQKMVCVPLAWVIPAMRKELAASHVAVPRELLSHWADVLTTACDGFEGLGVVSNPVETVTANLRALSEGRGG